MTTFKEIFEETNIKEASDKPYERGELKRIYFQLADAMWDARDTLEGNEFEPSFVKDFMKVFKEFDKWDSKHKWGATL